MSDNKGNPYELDTLSIAELRKLAAVMKIQAQREWSTSDFVDAINARRKSAKVARLVDEDEQENIEIPTGFARIRIHLTPGGSDSPLDVRVNNFYTSIPRGVLVDVPKEIRDTIRNSTEPVTREVIDKVTGLPKIQTTETQCYSFDDYGQSPGISGAVRGMADEKEYSLRVKYRDLYGAWPRRQSEEWKSFSRTYVEQANKAHFAKDEVEKSSSKKEVKEAA